MLTRRAIVNNQVANRQRNRYRTNPQVGPNERFLEQSLRPRRAPMPQKVQHRGLKPSHQLLEARLAALLGAAGKFLVARGCRSCTACVAPILASRRQRLTPGLPLGRLLPCLVRLFRLGPHVADPARAI